MLFLELTTYKWTFTCCNIIHYILILSSDRLYIDTTNLKEKRYVAYKRTWLNTCSLECYLKNDLFDAKVSFKDSKLGYLKSYEMYGQQTYSEFYVRWMWGTLVYDNYLSPQIPSHPSAMILVQSLMVSNIRKRKINIGWNVDMYSSPLAHHFSRVTLVQTLKETCFYCNIW
jgi:hypothetical protein